MAASTQTESEHAVLPFLQNPKFQEPVTLDFLDAELENDIKVEVRSRGEVLLTDLQAAFLVLSLTASM